MVRRQIVVIFVAFLAGCAGSPPPEPSSRLTVVGNAGLPAPSRQDLIAPDRLSLIGPSDTIGIDVFSVPALTRQVVVDASGRIALPLIGSLDAAGKTSEELATQITAQLKGRYLKNPDVTVNLKKSVSQVVTVDGEVAHPGLYPVTNQTTLMRAVAAAEGTTEFAKLEQVVILRSVDGKMMAGVYDLSAIRNGAYDDPPIYANDRIVVGNSPARRMFRDLIGVAPLLTAPIIAVLQR